jgi:predicted RND superfamily exporter protein
MVSIADAVWAADPMIGQKGKASGKKRRGLFSGGVISSPNLKVKLVIAAMRTHLPTFTAALYAPDPQSPEGFSYRIMLRSAERQTAAQKTHLIENVTRIVREEFPEAQVTGFFVLLTNLILSILRDQWLAFLVSTAGISACMLLAFRRLDYAAVAMVPNLLPIMTVTGIMGWLGFKINMGAAMIAAVSMGLSVDSSIHYIQAFLRARASGKTISASLGQVQKTVGRAMVLSTLALVAGFSVLALSEFVPTVYFGVLVSLAMLGGLAGNLVMLPLLLSVVSWRERRKEGP